MKKFSINRSFLNKLAATVGVKMHLLLDLTTNRKISLISCETVLSRPILKFV